MSPTVAKSKTRSQTPIVAETAFPRFLTELAAVRLKHNGDANKSGDGERLISGYKETGVFTLKNLYALGETLYNGPEVKDTVSRLLGYQMGAFTNPIIRELEKLDQPQIVTRLRDERGMPLDIEPTGMDDYVSIVCERDQGGNIVQEVLFYQGESKDPEEPLTVRERFMFTDHGPRQSRTLDDKVITEGFNILAIQRYEARGRTAVFPGITERAPEYLCNPLPAIMEVLHSNDEQNLSTPRHCSVEFDMMTSGILLPGKNRLMQLLNAFFPDFNTYTAGVSGLMHLFWEKNGPTETGKWMERVASPDKRLESTTSFQLNSPFIEYLLKGMVEKGDKIEYMPISEIREIERSRLMFLRCYAMALEQPRKPYGVNKLIYHSRVMMFTSPEKYARAAGRNRSVIHQFEEGQTLLDEHEVRAIVDLIKNIPGKNGEKFNDQKALDFADSLVESYVREINSWKGRSLRGGW